MGKESQQTMKTLTGDINARVDLFIKDLRLELTKRTPKRSGTASRGWQQVNRYDANKRGEQTVIRNDVKYIQPLEDGHSKQAPHGFINQAIDQVLKRDHGQI
jgi:hypothetical protein